jgi:type VI secretion system protein ImpJ
MSGQSVLWHEGMYLLPHHTQAAERFTHQHLARSQKWNLHYNWGLRTLDFDRDALGESRFVVRSLTARMRDGTLVAVPEDGSLEALDLKPALERASAVTVFLALPQLQPGKPNAPPDAVPEPPLEDGEPPERPAAQPAGDTRYLVDALELEDENTGDNPQKVHVRLLNLKLLLGPAEHPGYELLPIARVVKPAPADAVPELDRTYIPPVLACDAWQPLAVGILEGVYDRLGKEIERVAPKVVTRGISFDSRRRGAGHLLAALDVLNEGYALLNVVAFAAGVHPLLAYLELCRLAGQMAIFAETRRTPELPRYDHDDLGGCFYRVKHYLDQPLVPPDNFEERRFVGEGKRMQVTLEQEWLEPKWQMFVGVQSPLAAKECVALLTPPGNLEMKIGSATRVEEIFRRGERGLRFAHAPQPPEALPAGPGLVYFQLSRESEQREWEHVKSSSTLAIRLKENLIVGSIDRAETLTIRLGTQTATMEFTLYVLTQDA